MLKKIALLFLLPLGVAASPAIFFSAPGWWTKITAAIASSPFSKAPEAGVAAPVAQVPGDAGQKAGPSTSLPAASDNIPISDLGEVLRFDVTPGWVIAHWPRVSAGLAQLQLQGYRVLLVSGTAEDDLAGALTYYFNPRQELQRITLQGTTGSARKLVELLTTRHGFVRRLTNDPSSFVYEVPVPDKKVKSVLWVRPARVVKSEESYQRFQVALVMERPEKP